MMLQHESEYKEVSFENLIDFISKELKQFKNIGLIGDLGVGKTFFVQHFMEKIGFEKHKINSPTYNYCFEYTTEQYRIQHYDLYQIRDENQLLEIGLVDALEDDQIITLIEWIDRFETIEARCDLMIKILYQEKRDQRRYCYKLNA